MMIIKNIIKATIATTAVISSAFAMVLPGNALSPVTYKAASNYKLVPMGPTSCVVMSYTINQETVIKNKTNGNGEYSRLEKMTKTVALTDAEKAAGYKIQFVDISINCTSGTYKPFWAVSYTY